MLLSGNIYRVPESTFKSNCYDFPFGMYRTTTIIIIIIIIITIIAR